MTIQVKIQELTAVVTKNESAILKNNKYRGLKDPFLKRRMLLVLGDTLIMVLAVFGAFLLYYQTANPSLDVRDYWYWFFLLLSGWWTLSWLNDLYHIPSSFDKIADAKRIAVVGVINLVVYLALYVLIPNELPLAFCLYFLAITWLAITLWRIVCAIILGRFNFQRRALILGTGSTALTITQAIKEHLSGYEIIGYIDSNAPEQQQDTESVIMLDKWANLTTFVQEHQVSDIVLAMRRSLHVDQLQVLLKCFEQGVRIQSMPELFEEITGRVPVEHIDDRWLVFLPINWDSRGVYLIIKRAMDIVIAGIGILLLLPLFPFLALAIRLDSPGPIFYRPKRLGRGGKPFYLWKFRTMVSDADRIGDPTFTTRNDQRITRVGRILRTTHIDEFPQFINILAGEMSVVGPRPERHVPALEESIPYYRTRYAVKPGATGWALVNQGYAEGIEGTLIKLQYDLHYIKHQSLSLDLLILGKSIIHMLTMGGQ